MIPINVLLVPWIIYPTSSLENSTMKFSVKKKLTKGRSQFGFYFTLAVVAFCIDSCYNHRMVEANSVVWNRRLKRPYLESEWNWMWSPNYHWTVLPGRKISQKPYLSYHHRWVTYWQQRKGEKCLKMTYIILGWGLFFLLTLSAWSIITPTSLKTACIHCCMCVCIQARQHSL